MTHYDTNLQSEGECNDCRGYEKEIKHLREQLDNIHRAEHESQERKARINITEQINSVLETYLPDDYWEDIRWKLSPLIQRLIEQEVDKMREDQTMDMEKRMTKCNACGSVKLNVHLS